MRRRLPRWQQGFDASLTDVFQVQADIATKVASALDAALGDSVRHELAAKPTENLAAYDAYLKGEAASQAMAVADPASLRRAISFYQQAVTLDSGFFSAWAQLARAYSVLYYNSTPTPDLATQARDAANRAHALGPDRPEGQLALGDYYGNILQDNGQWLTACEAGLKLAPNNVDLLVTAALAEQGLGDWDAALQHLAKAGALDPRSANTARRTAVTLLRLRRYPEALAAVDRGLALAPTNLQIIEVKAMVALAQGDLAGPGPSSARPWGPWSRRRCSPSSGTILTFTGCWTTPSSSSFSRSGPVPLMMTGELGASFCAQTYHLRGNSALARVYADSAQLAMNEQLRATPDDGQRHVLRGLALAYLGRKEEAISEGERGVALMPISRDSYTGAYNQHQLVRIYLRVGEPEKALDQLEPLLKVPYILSSGWLKIDPTFAPLRGNPRFERLVAGK